MEEGTVVLSVGGMSQSNLPSALTIVLTIAGPPGPGLKLLC